MLVFLLLIDIGNKVCIQAHWAGTFPLVSAAQSDSKAFS